MKFELMIYMITVVASLMMGAVTIAPLLNKSPKDKLKKLECKLAEKEKELEVMWQFEKEGTYAFGNRAEIIKLEVYIAGLKKKIELLKEESKHDN